MESQTPQVIGKLTKICSFVCHMDIVSKRACVAQSCIGSSDDGAQRFPLLKNVNNKQQTRPKTTNMIISSHIFLHQILRIKPSYCLTVNTKRVNNERGFNPSNIKMKISSGFLLPELLHQLPYLKREVRLLSKLSLHPVLSRFSLFKMCPGTIILIKGAFFFYIFGKSAL